MLESHDIDLIEEEARDMSFETFIESRELSIRTITEEIDYLRECARDYDGYDFSDNIIEFLREAICI